MKLGDLEREVMEVIWRRPLFAFTVRDVCADFPDHAYTTVMTVLSRLTAKGFLLEKKRGRVNTFVATASREDYIAGLIMEALSDTNDRHAALARFVESMPSSDKNFFSKILPRRSKQ